MQMACLSFRASSDSTGRLHQQSRLQFYNVLRAIGNYIPARLSSSDEMTTVEK